MSFILYKAATNAAPNPSNPPTPAIIAGAAFVLTGAAAPELELVALPLDALLDAGAELVEGAFVVAGTLVVIAVTDVVEAGIEEEEVDVTTAIEDEDETLADDDDDEDVVVTAEADARDAEKLEQSPSPTDAATARSDWSQALMRQPATLAWMEERPEPHWQASSLSWQPATEMADVRQGIAHDGSPAKFWADTKLPPTATRAIKVVLMLNNRLEGLQTLFLDILREICSK